MALEVGSRLGVFEVTGHLGEGGMGVVFRATETTLDRDVALKASRTPSSTTPNGWPASSEKRKSSPR